MAEAQKAVREKRLPDYQAMTKINGGWVRIGAGWRVRSGENAVSVQLNTIPVGGWDGRFTLFEPSQQEETPQN